MVRLCDKSPLDMCEECKDKYIVNFTEDDIGEEEKFICCDSYGEAKDLEKRIKERGRFAGIHVKPDSIILLIPRKGGKL